MRQKLPVGIPMDDFIIQVFTGKVNFRIRFLRQSATFTEKPRCLATAGHSAN